MYAIKRSGFAMIMAIFIIVAIAFGGTLLLNSASVAGKSVNDNYIYTQAELLADSALEYATMRAQGTNTAGGNPCLNQLNISVQDQGGNTMYDITATLTYSFVFSDAADQTVNAVTGTCNRLNADYIGSGSSSVLVDVIVADHNLSTEPIRVHKRSWQKL